MQRELGDIGDLNAPGPDGRARRVWPIVSFNAIYLIAATIVALARGNLEFLFYISILPLAFGAVWIVHRRVGLGAGVLWGLSIWGLAHMAGGLVIVPADWPVCDESRVLYTWWLVPDRLKFDNVVHAYGFGMTTWVCWQALRGALWRPAERVRPTLGLLVLSAAAGLGFGALNEVAEFAATKLVPETNVGGYDNTGWDLVANLVGATIAVTLIRCGARRG